MNRQIRRHRGVGPARLDTVVLRPYSHTTVRYNQAQLQLQLRNPDEALDHLAGGLHLPALLRRVERRELAVDIHHLPKVLVVVRVDAAINRARLRGAFERARQGGGSDTTTARSPHLSWETLCVSWHIHLPASPGTV